MTSKSSGKNNVGIVPLHDRVLIREIRKEDKKTASGIIIPESVKDDHSTRQGVVVAVGKGKTEDGKLVPISVEVGDKVLFGWGEEVSVGEENFFVVKDSDIIATVK